MRAYSARVTANGGVVEATACATSTLTSLDSKSLLQSATFVLAPSGYKSGVIYSQVPSNGNGDLTVTRAGGANTTVTRVNSAGLIESPVTNLWLYSEQFDNAIWTNANFSAFGSGSIVDYGVSPDGNQTADLLNEGTGSGVKSLTQGVGSTSGNTYTLSVYAKTGVGGRYFRISNNNGSDATVWAAAQFDLQNVSYTTGVGSGGGTVVSASITSVGNGWYRCVLVCSIASTSNALISSSDGGAISSSDSRGRRSYTGVGNTYLFWGAQFEQSNSAGIYVPTTSSARTYFAGITQDGLYPANVPQLDYSLGGCPNFLFEPQRRNICLRSESLDNAIWSLTGFSAFGSGSIVDSGIAPDGNQTADLLNESNVGGIKSLLQGISSTSGNTYTLSVYAKTGLGGRYFRLNSASTSDSTIWASAQFDLQNVSYTTGVGSGGGTVVSASITSVGNGWYRCVLTASLNSANNGIIISASDGAAISSSDSRGRRNYIGVGNTYLFWGAQFEDNGSFGSVNYPTSYIPTTSAAVTRNATSFTRSNIYTNGLIGASGGTWLIEVKNNIVLTRDTIGGIYIGDNSVFNSGNYIRLASGGAGIRIVFIKTGGVILYTTLTDTFKAIVKWNGSSLHIFVNGLNVATDNTFSTTNMDYFGLSSLDIPRYISQMALWNTSLSDAQCISLSSYTTFEVAKQLLDKVIADAIADGGTYKQSNYDASIDRIVKAMEAFGTTNIASKMVAWVDPEYLPYRQETTGTASNSGCRKLYDLFRRADFTQNTAASMPLLLLHSGENYWANSGVTSNYCSTPNATANQITGDIDIRIKVSMTSWTPASNMEFVSKYVLSAIANQRAYRFRINTDGTLALNWSVDGTSVNTLSSTSTVSVGLTANAIKWVRVTLTVNNGLGGNETRFYTSDDGATWTQFGATITKAGTTNIFASTGQVEVGSSDGGSNTISGKIYRAQIYNGINGALAVDFNPQSFNPSTSQTQWTSATGEVWTINTPLNTSAANNNYKGALVYRNMIMADGIDDSMASSSLIIGGQTLGVYSSNRLLNNVTNALSVFLELSQNYGSNNNSFFIGNSNDTGTVRRIQAVTLASSGVNVATSSTDVFTARLSLHSVTMDSSASPNKILLHYNTNSVTAAYVNNNTGSFSTSFPLYLFARNGTTGLANMSLHDLMLVTDITKRTEMENIIRSMSSNFAF